MAAGRVQVNGESITELGFKVDPEKDVVTVDNHTISLSDTPTYLMLYKPPGYLSTMHDPHQRKTVKELVPVQQHPGLFPVGRLDADTTGLLLFTTDGDLAQHLLHPSFEKKKMYFSRVKGRPSQEELAILEKGVPLKDGVTAPAEARLIEEPFSEKEEGWAAAVGPVKRGESIVRLVIHEGKKHQVKRMLEAVGHPVHALFRSTFGSLELTGVQEGKWRYLSQAETERLQADAKLGSTTGVKFDQKDGPQSPQSTRKRGGNDYRN